MLLREHGGVLRVNTGLPAYSIDSRPGPWRSETENCNFLCHPAPVGVVLGLFTQVSSSGASLSHALWYSSLPGAVAEGILEVIIIVDATGDDVITIGNAADENVYIVVVVVTFKAGINDIVVDGAIIDENPN
ncbi:hypothetical protein NDU88_003849 [Pleurodeles waltl]|uniref:Uncharacterized protein n=1 Tax=Pleurodeles waltl TaxID=8319 RepID=A0AAV7KYL2_PLEWA|nr:hypothetical protein NDU88_003849 [Pleurodeles waltl]